MSDGIEMKANEFVPIRIQYYEATESAFIRLSWQSTSQ